MLTLFLKRFIIHKISETDEVEIKIERALIESLDDGSKQNAVY